MTETTHAMPDGLRFSERNMWEAVAPAQAEVRILLERIARLRASTHEIQEKADERNRELAKRVGQYEAAWARAQETVKDIKADWTTDPPSQEEGGFWRYTSQNTVEALALLASRWIAAEDSLRAIAAMNLHEVTTHARDVAKAALAPTQEGQP